MSEQLTMAEEHVVAGTPECPACCNGCLEYGKVFNLCRRCGRDERARYGCEHRIGVGGICDGCRTADIASEINEPLATLGADSQKLKALLDLLNEFLALKLHDNREELLRLQVRGLELLSDAGKV